MEDRELLMQRKEIWILMGQWKGGRVKEVEVVGVAMAGMMFVFSEAGAWKGVG
ncbi:conserved hypothetical protein [Ricinus communis]|uniref:Uncharacterized protein n=1 Tax=Ricinus communis TaxID=3988 RepID=B9SUD8_RICCO|nr:conserved hypothetical protein [Ricinus communis]